MTVSFGSWLRSVSIVEYRTRRLLAVTLAVLVVITAPGASRAQTSAAGAIVRCVSPIMSCGCTITSRGFFQIGANLSSAQGLTANGGCIDVRSPKVVLSAGIQGGGAFDITGPGGSAPTGIGIHVLRGSNNDVLELPGTVDGWDIGIEIEGNRNVAQDFTATGSGTAGIVILRAQNNSIASFTANSNLDLGVWITGGTRNQVRGGSVNSNGNIGLLIGCSSDGIIGARCRPLSSWNRISNLSIDSNTNLGLAIDKDNKKNVINGVGAHTNGMEDLFDATPDCGTNLWFFNFFTNVNQTCIH